MTYKGESVLLHKHYYQFYLPHTVSLTIYVCSDHCTISQRQKELLLNYSVLRPLVLLNHPIIFIRLIRNGDVTEIK